MEPDRQIEIQLGHMCNNRCVFCVSGQRTEMREALPIVADPVLERLREARESGITKVTLLGGEPTIQPEFLRVVRAAVDLGFGEIVIFTNGVKTARGTFIDEVLATGGNFTWRLSFQGATARAHDRTTRKLGSFQRLIETLENLAARKQRVTVNMCVVQSNFESVESFPELLLKHGAEQLHLDMIRPLDAGVRTEDEMRAMLPRYTELVPHLERMVAGFPRGFDLNIGNLPYCVAPGLAEHIHHDGTATLTVSVDRDDSLSEPWDKYETKRRDKIKPDSCRSCVFDAQCSGVFDTYRRFYGTSELTPITRERLSQLDPKRRLFTLHAAHLIERVATFVPAAPFARKNLQIDSHAQQVLIEFAAGSRSAVIALRSPGAGLYSTDEFSVHVVDEAGAGADVRALARQVFEALAPDVDWRIARCVARLGRGAPFGELTFESVQVAREEPAASVVLRHRDGAGVTIALSLRDEVVRGGYRLDRVIDEPPRSLVEGVRAAMSTLRGAPSGEATIPRD